MKITLAIPKGKKGYKDRMNKELSLAANIKDKNTRQSIEQGLTKIIGQIQDGCVYLWNGKDLWSYEYPLKQYIYHCGDSFVVPDVEVETAYGMVVLDNKEATIGLLKGKSIGVVWTGTSGIPGKHSRGGQSAARFERLRGEQTKQWYRKVGDKVARLIQ